MSYKNWSLSHITSKLGLFVAKYLLKVFLHCVVLTTSRVRNYWISDFLGHPKTLLETQLYLQGFLTGNPVKLKVIESKDSLLLFGKSAKALETHFSGVAFWKETKLFFVISHPAPDVSFWPAFFLYHFMFDISQGSTVVKGIKKSVDCILEIILKAFDLPTWPALPTYFLF